MEVDVGENDVFGCEQRDDMVVRLYVGGLGSTVKPEELQRRFEQFGRVECVEVVKKKFHEDVTVGDCRGFAYINLKVFRDADIERCISTLNYCRWKGRELRVARAKPHFSSQAVRQSEV